MIRYLVFKCYCRDPVDWWRAERHIFGEVYKPEWVAQLPPRGRL